MNVTMLPSVSCDSESMNPAEPQGSSKALFKPTSFHPPSNAVILEFQLAKTFLSHVKLIIIGCMSLLKLCSQ